MFKKNLILSAFLLVTGVSAMAQQEIISTPQETKQVSLTVYNQDFAVIREQRTLNLNRGLNLVRYEGVAQRIDATSINLKSLTEPNGVRVLEQNYQYDLISPNTILDKSVGKTIKIRKDGEVLEGILLSTPNNGTVVQLTDGRILLNPTGQIEVTEMPTGLLSKPSLLWYLNSNKAGTHTTEASYMTDGINWKADYVAVVTEDEKKIDITGWVTLTNRSGATYENAQLQLMAGDVRRVKEQRPSPVYMREEVMMAADAAGGFQEESFFEYHLYTLEGNTNIRQNETKQLSLMAANDVSVIRKLVYNAQKSDKVRVELKLKNSESNNMGMPLPKGKVRVYKGDKQGNLQFLGEDLIDHTPRNEEVSLYIGDAFDVVGERTQKNYDESKSWITQTFEIKVRNRKETKTDVWVEESLYGDWEITESSHQYNKLNASTIEFPLSLDSDEEAVITYVVRWRRR